MNDATRNLAWKLNWWRQSELEGALLLGRIVSLADSSDLCLRLTRHCAEEAEHSRMWAEVLVELELPHIRIHRSYQSFFLRHTGVPQSLLDVLAFTQVFERRVDQRFRQECRSPDTPLVARSAYARMIADERDHLAWVAEWLANQVDAMDASQRFEIADRGVFAELEPFERCMWQIADLGSESWEDAV
jgi:tRNA isopentenyl-2-thiomethyl-A-37 hydroxylase MiaE